MGISEQMLAISREFLEIFSDRFFTIAAHVRRGRIPVGNAPLDRLLEQQLAESNVQTGAKTQYRNLDAGFAKRTGRDGGGIFGSQYRFMLER